MNLKVGVKLLGLRPETLVAIIVVGQVFRDHGRTFTITSVCDSKHGEGSLHFKGCAFDCRTTSGGISQEEAQKIRDVVRSALGPEFDVVLESDHIHVEFDPKA